MTHLRLVSRHLVAIVLLCASMSEARVPRPSPSFYAIYSCGATLASCRSLCKTTAHPRGYPAVVTSAAQQSMITTAWNSLGVSASCSSEMVMGGYRGSDGMYRWTEGPWGTGSTGTPLYQTGSGYTYNGGYTMPGMYTAWNSGEPNNAGNGEDHIFAYTTGTWNDASDGNSMGCACREDPPTTQTLEVTRSELTATASPSAAPFSGSKTLSGMKASTSHTVSSSFSLTGTPSLSFIAHSRSGSASSSATPTVSNVQTQSPSTSWSATFSGSSSLSFGAHSRSTSTSRSSTPSGTMFPSRTASTSMSKTVSHTATTSLVAASGTYSMSRPATQSLSITQSSTPSVTVQTLSTAPSSSTSRSATRSPSLSYSHSPTVSYTVSASKTVSKSSTVSQQLTRSVSTSDTGSKTASPTVSKTVSPTHSSTPPISSSPSLTPSPSPSLTASTSSTHSPTVSHNTSSSASRNTPTAQASATAPSETDDQTRTRTLHLPTASSPSVTLSIPLPLGDWPDVVQNASRAINIASLLVSSASAAMAVTAAALDVVSCGEASDGSGASLGAVVDGGSPLSYIIAPGRKAGLDAAVYINVAIAVGALLLNAAWAVVVVGCGLESAAGDETSGSHPPDSAAAPARRWWHVVTRWEAHGDARTRFPAAALRVCCVLLPGTSLVAAGLLAQAIAKSSGASVRGVVAGAVGCVLVVAFVLLIAVRWLHRVALHPGSGVTFVPAASAGIGAVRRFLSPSGQWTPDATSLAIGSVLCDARGERHARWLQPLLLSVSAVAGALCGVAAAVPSEAACEGLLIGVAVMLLAVACLLAVRRPFCVAVDGLLLVVQYTVLSTMFLLKGLAQSVPVWLELTQAVTLLLWPVASGVSYVLELHAASLARPTAPESKASMPANVLPQSDAVELMWQEERGDEILSVTDERLIELEELKRFQEFQGSSATLAYETEPAVIGSPLDSSDGVAVSRTAESSSAEGETNGMRDEGDSDVHSKSIWQRPRYWGATTSAISSPQVHSTHLGLTNDLGNKAALAVVGLRASDVHAGFATVSNDDAAGSDRTATKADVLDDDIL